MRAGLRALAVLAIVAMLLDVPLGPSRRVDPWVALDVSESMAETPSAAGPTTARWQDARRVVDSLLAAGADSLLLFGDSARGGDVPARPADQASNLAGAIDLAVSAGRPLLVVTDGRVDGIERLRDLPRGSRVFVLGGDFVSDAGIMSLEAPAAVLAGDTVEIRVGVRAASGGAAATRVGVRLNDRALGTVAVRALGAYEEEVAVVRAVVPGLPGAQPLVAALERTPSDAVPANDSALRLVDVRAEPSAVLVSTSPDEDARFALELLRGTRRGAIRGYWRVAPTRWVSAETARPVPEEAVRRAVREAGLLVLHGDTAFFGAPRSVARGALVLMPAITDQDEWFAAEAGDSPLRSGIAELPWSVLPPLQVSSVPVRTGRSALTANRPGRNALREAIVVEEAARRVVVVRANGFWRWRTRGGRQADAYDALWGSIYDWVGAVRRGATASGASEVMVRTELVPRQSTLQSSEVGEGTVRDRGLRARGQWWLAALAIAALCVEWVLRRRAGGR